MALTHYVLSPEADQDLAEIFDYTHSQFGLDQAVAYLSDLDVSISHLVHYPLSGRERPEIRPELRSFPKASHVIFYRIMADHIRIIRVLHGRMDIPKFLDER